MPATEPRFTILLCNSVGEIARCTADTAEECRDAILDLVNGTAFFEHGDTIRVIERED